MNSSMMRGVRRGVQLLATGAIMVGGAAIAQTPPGAVVQSLATDNGAELRGYLTTLANNPRSLDALIGAGRAALEMGDTNAALTFYGRADEISPRNARVKAGMASTLVQVGQPQAALQLFAEAAALGAPDVELAADRGLAFDLSGDPRHAQQNYLVALRRREDAELRRRLALSLAISGQREAALQIVDAQLRRNDRAAWRIQAFILALTGDTSGANRIAQSVMPAGSAQQMAPFFARLHGLSPAQKAMAVHLGRFPSDGRAHPQTAHVDTSADPAAVALAMGRPPSATQPRTQVADAAPRSRASRRRPEETRDSSDPYRLRGSRRSRGQLAPPVTRRQPTEVAASPPTPSEPQPAQVAQLNTRWAGAPYQAAPQQPSGAPVQPPAPAPVQPPPVSAQPPGTAPSQAMTPPQSSAAVAQRDSTPVVTSTISLPGDDVAMQSEPVSPSVSTAATGSVASSIGTEIALAPASPPATGEIASPYVSVQPEPAPPSNATGTSTLADIAALVNTLPQESQASTPATSPPPRRTVPTRSVQTATAESRPARARATQPARPANPSRHWVQIATGPNLASLPREFARLRTQAPELARRTAYTAPLRATNRLLVGPFASDREAQAFVNQLSRRNVSAFAWTSAAGQEIDRVAAR